jgi:hypothetical protein
VHEPELGVLEVKVMVQVTALAEMEVKPVGSRVMPQFPCASSIFYMLTYISAALQLRLLEDRLPLNREIKAVDAGTVRNTASTTIPARYELPHCQ